MYDIDVHPVSPAIAASAYIDEAKYKAMYQHSIDDPDGFWAEQAKAFVTWFSDWDSVSQWDFATANIRWFEGASLNVSYNCLDRHLENRGDQTAIIWEGDSPGEDK
ncbi:MAG TPA: acetyl-coenzyme A synthetase N-terminal domain-containing protein, partial [Gammaproteobacteria bacterium]|nr:acetyl-coenzyme A synthetase N-terminal domain-containing protein [Gammaproteobacteria bacterium]